MKATELMIGDWIQVPPSGRRKMKITQLCEDWGEMDDVDPVPITREILEKNEFAYCERNGAFYAYAEESYSNQMVEIILFNVESEYRNNQLHINEANYKEETLIHLMECNYVHNLQHVFRVCGIKKEIVL